ncbi:MAG: Panacea domain-containing protein [Thermoguttaceae bacterium]|jgi:uncharacterized phage-associated protein
MTYFRFSTQKTIQAVGVLLRLARGRMGRLRLLKLLYIADRDSLREFRRPIIGCRTVAMKNGPLHSEVFNLIKGEHMQEPAWSEHIHGDGCEVTLEKDPGVSELSAAEVRTLTQTFEKYATTDEWDLVEITHGFPEWSENYPDKAADTSRTIPFRDLIRAVGLAAEEQAILQEAQEEFEVSQMLACGGQR